MSTKKGPQCVHPPRWVMKGWGGVRWVSHEVLGWGIMGWVGDEGVGWGGVVMKGWGRVGCVN